MMTLRIFRPNVPSATVNLYLEDGSLVADQETGSQGHTILWHIPELEYTLEARAGSASGRTTLFLTEDRTVRIQLQD